MREKNGLSIISLIVGAVGCFLINIAQAGNYVQIGFGLALTLISLVCGIIALFNKKYKKICAIIGVVLCLLSLLGFNNLTQKYKEAQKDLEDYETKTYTITFDTNGGEAIEPITVTADTYLEPIIPKKDGYQFKNWILNKSIFRFEGYVESRITSDVTLKATYIKLETKGVDVDRLDLKNDNQGGTQSTPNNNQGSQTKPNNNQGTQGSQTNSGENNDNLSMGQKNALAKAKSYLSHSAFSERGLIKQLEYEGFTTEEATYGVKNCGANWTEEALKKAKSYLSHSSFSENGLIRQLEYEEFTKEQAEYGVKNSGANWNEQAAKKAKSYLSHSSFSKAGLIKQLEYEGFTREQAEYGVSAVGY